MKKKLFTFAAASVMMANSWAADQDSSSEKFDKVMSQLDKGGTFLMYEEADYSGFKLIKDFALGLPQIKGDSAKEKIVEHIYKSLDDYGLFDVEAYGISNKKSGKGSDFKMFAITKKGYEKKAAAQLTGGAEARLQSLQHMAADADLVVSMRLNPGVFLFGAGGKKYKGSDK